MEKGTTIVTGGASGIGLAVTHKLLEAGWKVAIADAVQANLDSAREALKAHAAATRFELADVSDEAAVKDMVARVDRDFGPITGLVNSAGIARDIPVFETPVELFRKIIDVNLTGSFIMAKETAARMRDHGRGSIILIASISGVRGNRGRTAYGASKGGVITLMQVLANELAEFNIRVNAIAPGPVETPLVKAVHSTRSREDWLRLIPQKRYAAPEEIAGAATFLLDDSQSSFVTGHTLCVDGGFSGTGLI